MSKLLILDSGNQPPAPPTPAELKDFKGNLGGLIIPGLPYQANHALFTPSYPVYDDSWRQYIRDTYKGEGLKHFPLSLFEGPIYHNIYPYWDGKNINQCLEELWEDGFIPVGFYHRDDGFKAQGVEKSLVPIIVPMWEMNGPLGNDTVRINQVIAETQSDYPDALCYVHFTPNHAAGGSPEGQWWSDQQRNGVTGILYQHDGRDTPQGCHDRCVDFLVRFGSGYHGWPKGLEFVLFETTTYQSFWDGWTEDQSNKWNTEALNPRTVTIEEGGQVFTGRFSGYCNGGGFIGDA